MADPEAGGGLYVPPAPGATIDEAIEKDDKKPVKDEPGKAKLDEIKSVVLNAMATKDADNAILLQRIQQRFERCAVLRSASQPMQTPCTCLCGACRHLSADMGRCVRATLPCR